MDQRPRVTCCQFADASEITEDPSLYDCPRCPVAQAQQALWPENRQAWRDFHLVASRFLVEFGLTGAVFTRLCADRPQHEVLDTVQRFAVMADYLMPRENPRGA